MTDEFPSSTSKMNNYAQPYRNLPAEIRLQIWSLVIPQRVTAMRSTELDDLDPLDQHGGLGLMPSPEAQLLRLNKEVHHEILHMFKKVEVHLHCYIDYNFLWPMLAVAMKSPVLHTLHYPWHNPDQLGNLYEHFLPKLLVEGSPCALRCLHINIFKAGFLRKVHVPWSPDQTRYLHGWALPEEWILASFSGACLQKGVVSQEVIINIKEIEQRGLGLWTAEGLYDCMRAESCEPLPPAALKLRILHDCIRGHVGPIKRSNIQIATDFSETDRRGKYRGTVKFTRVFD